MKVGISRTVGKMLSILITCVGFITPVQASNLWQLDSLHTAAIPSSKLIENQAKTSASYQLQINQQLLTSLEPRVQVELPLPGETILFTVEQKIAHPNGSHTIVGRISRLNTAQQQSDIIAAPRTPDELALFTVSQRSLFAQVTTTDASYSITGNIRQAVLQPTSATKKIPNHAEFSDVVLPPTKEVTSAQNQSQQPSSATSSLFKPTPRINYNLRSDFAADDNRQLATIDVLALYSQAAEDYYHGDVSTRIYHLFAVANQALADSGAFIKLNPVRLQKVEPSQPEIQHHIKEMSARSNNFKQLSEWRASSGADLITLFTPSHQGSWACGQAEISVLDDSMRSVQTAVEIHPDRTHSAVHLDCSDATFAHEIGHHLGLNHGNGRADKGFSFPYARGYFVHQNFSTIMVYSNLFQTKEVLNFSNPARLCEGQPCGKKRDDADGADAVMAMNRVRFFVADINQPQNLTLSFEQAVAQVKDSALKSCLIELQQLNPELKFASDLTLLGYFPWQGCSPQDPEQRLVSDLSDLTLFPNLLGLSLHAKNITDFTPLTKLPKLAELSLYHAMNVTEMPWLSQLTQLKALELMQVNLGGTNHLQGLTHLRKLNLSFIGKVESYAGLNGLNALESINIFGSYSEPYFTDLSFLAGKTQLRDLTLSNTQVSDLQPLTLLAPGQLTDFDFATNQPINYQPLQQQYNLSELSLYHSFRSDCRSLQQLLPHMKQLRAYNPPSNCRSHSPSLPVFAELPLLQFEANAFSGTMVNVPKVQAIDPEDGILTATPDKINNFPLGETTILWRAIDSQNNRVETPQTVQIKDTTAPLLFGPSVYYYNNGFNEAVSSDFHEHYDFYSKFYADDLVSGLGTIRPDADDPIYLLSMKIQKPDLFVPGINQVTITAKDHSGNETTMVSYFVNQMRDGPRISVTEPLKLTITEREGISGQNTQLQQFLSTLMAKDKQGRILAVTANIPAWIAPGRHLIPLHTQDADGLIDERLLEVEVGDFTGPVFAKLPPLEIVTNNQQGISSNHPVLLNTLANLTAKDEWSNPVSFKFQLTDRYQPGEHSITISAVDAVGNVTNQQLFLKVTHQARKRNLLKLLQMSAQPSER